MSLLGALFNKNAQHFSQAFPGVKDCTSAEMQQAVRDWFGLYYALEPVKEEDPCQRIPVAVVSKLQKACFAEYDARITQKGSKGEFLARCLEELDNKKRQALQLAMIGGEAWLKPIPMGDRFVFGVVRRDAVSVLARNSAGAVTDMITTEVTSDKSGWYSLLERRTLGPDGRLTITNKLYLSQDGENLGVPVSLASLPRYEALQPEYTFTLPLGGLGLVPIKMTVENTVDGSADGVSIYASAAGLIHNINHNEWLLNQEFDNGAVRVFAQESIVTKQRASDGTVINKKVMPGLFVALDGDSEEAPLTIFSPTLREQSFLSRKTEYLRNVESVIGIKRGLLSEVETAERTAKEITSSEGDYNLTIQDLWEVWERAARQAMELCGVLGQMYSLCDGSAFDPQEDLSISWGNGVLFDADKAWSEMMAMVASGMLKPELALAWKYDLPHETEADLEKIRKEYMPQMDELTEEEV